MDSESAEEAERSEARAALREVEKAAAKDLIKETMAAARRVAGLGKWRKSAHANATAIDPTTPVATKPHPTELDRQTQLQRQQSAPSNQAGALAAVAALSAGQPMPARWPSFASSCSVSFSSDIDRSADEIHDAVRDPLSTSSGAVTLDSAGPAAPASAAADEVQIEDDKGGNRKATIGGMKSSIRRGTATASASAPDQTDRSYPQADLGGSQQAQKDADDQQGQDQDSDLRL